MTTLVTGATGLLGGHVVDVLAKRGIAARALVRPGEDVTRLRRAGVEICWGDLTDPASLAAATCGIERLLHCAARTGPWGPERDYYAANVRGLQALVEAALAAGVQRLVHVSSITVYGNDVRGAADESSPFREEPNPYSRTKIAGERLLAKLARERGAPVTIVRPGWIYGPRDTASFARFAALIERGAMVMVGGGDNHVPLIHVRDAARGVVLAAEAPDADGRAYILVNDEPVTQRAYLWAIAEALHVSPPKRRMPYRLTLAVGASAERTARLLRWRRPPPLMRYGVQMLGGENRFSIARARRELAFSPQVCLREGVAESVAWYRTTLGGAEHPAAAIRLEA